MGARGAIVLPIQKQASHLIVGTYSHKKGGFGFVVPTDPSGSMTAFAMPVRRSREANAAGHAYSYGSDCSCHTASA